MFSGNTALCCPTRRERHSSPSERLSGQLIGPRDRPLVTFHCCRPLLGEVRGLKKLQVSEQLSRAKPMKTNIEARHLELNAQVQYRLNANGQVLSQFDTSQVALLALRKEIKVSHGYREVSKC